MITKIYIDNYKCFSNFELPFGHVNIIFGRNGTGKTSIFEMLQKIQQLTTGLAKADIFSFHDKTRWDSRSLQSFGLDAVSLYSRYNYILEIAHDDKGVPRIHSESLQCNARTIFALQNSQAQVFNDDFSPGVSFPMDPSQSGLAIIPFSPGNSKIMEFKKLIAKLIFVKLNPAFILPGSEKEAASPKKDMSNFVSWYRHLSQEYQQNIIELQMKLKDILPGFQGMDLPSFSQTHRGLQVSFSNSSLLLTELSDGQMALIILYTLLYGIKGLGYILCIDEPENYLSLEEIQPWLMEVLDSTGHALSQALIISHHPEAIDYLAPEHGIWLERTKNGPVKRKEISLPSNESLKLSELIERGWD